MIGNVIAKLCDYSDELYSQGKKDERRIVQKCLEIVHKCWDESELYKRIDAHKKPEDIYEEWVLTIPDIKVFTDPSDNHEFYELDGNHFDTPKEIWGYLVGYRTRRITNLRA